MVHDNAANEGFLTIAFALLDSAAGNAELTVISIRGDASRFESPYPHLL